MLLIDRQGHVLDPRIKRQISSNIEHGPMHNVRGIILHQTDSSSAQSTLSQYNKKGVAGAHFLIDKDGNIYQTASIFKQTWHVGPLKARCVAEMRCSSSDLKALKKFSPMAEHRREMRKSVPDRYPSNTDSIGIEVVGQALPVNEPDPDKKVYEQLTFEQKESVQWLVLELARVLKIPMDEVFRHPAVSRKNKTEAAGAEW